MQLPFLHSQVLLAPPLYRHRPHWYQHNLTQVSTRFSQTFATDVPSNFRLLPAFPSQSLMPDGQFLDPVSGLHYLLHLFDHAELILDQPSMSGEAQFAQVRENVRHHDDRMAFIENRHSQLQNQVDLKVAVDSEFNDWMLNRSEEDWLTVKGLPRLSQVVPSEWQNAARRQVADLIKHVLHLNKARVDFTVVLVINPFRHVTSGPTTYNVRINSASASKNIRDLFSGFFRRNRPMKLPQDLRGISVRNKITKETKIRIEILRAQGELHKASNPGSSYHLRGYESRPLLAIYPPQNSGGQQRTYNFIQAATTLSTRFSDDHLVQIYQVVGNSCMGKLRSMFIVLNDDDRDRCAQLVSQSRSSRGRRGPAVPQPGSGSGSGSSATVHFGTVQTSHGSVHGEGSGVGLEAGFLSSLRSGPPPPPPPPSKWTHPEPEVTLEKSRSRSRSKSRSRSRSPSADTQKKSRRSRSRSSSRSSSHGTKKKSKGKSKSSKRRRSPSTSSSSGSGSSSSSRSPSPHKKRSKKKSKAKK